MNQSFRFGYAAGQQAVNHLSNMTRQEASQKILSVILSVLTFVLGFLLAKSMATFGGYMVFDMLEAWAIICVLWFIPCLVILLLRLESTLVKKKMIFRYVGKNMGLYSLASIVVFSVVAAILGRIYNGDSSSIMVWILPVFPITLPIWLNRRFKFVLTKGARAVEEQYSAYQHERMNLFLARAKEHFGCGVYLHDRHCLANGACMRMDLMEPDDSKRVQSDRYSGQKRLLNTALIHALIR